MQCENGRDYILLTAYNSLDSILWVLCSVILILLGPIDDGEIRLIPFANATDQGLVEIYMNGSWGTICDDYFTVDAGSVLCRQLGYAGFLKYACCSRWGQGQGKISIERIGCNGTENHILDCNINHLGNPLQLCNHREDVGIQCTGNDDFNAS